MLPTEPVEFKAGFVHTRQSMNHGKYYHCMRNSDPKFETVV